MESIINKERTKKHQISRSRRQSFAPTKETASFLDYLVNLERLSFLKEYGYVKSALQSNAINNALLKVKNEMFSSEEDYEKERLAIESKWKEEAKIESVKE